MRAHAGTPQVALWNCCATDRGVLSCTYPYHAVSQRHTLPLYIIGVGLATVLLCGLMLLASTWFAAACPLCSLHVDASTKYAEALVPSSCYAWHDEGERRQRAGRVELMQWA
jgi:hypothetical protein